MITVREEVPLEVPREKLPLCDRVAMPKDDSQWLDLPGHYIDAIQVLDKCSARISAFWKWHDAQFIEAPE